MYLNLKRKVMEYKQALMEALANKELVEQYDRLYNRSLGVCLNSMIAGGINYQIDLQTGRIKDEIQGFDKFFYEMVWSRLAKEAFKK